MKDRPALATGHLVQVAGLAAHVTGPQVRMMGRLLQWTGLAVLMTGIPVQVAGHDALVTGQPRTTTTQQRLGPATGHVQSRSTARQHPNLTSICLRCSTTWKTLCRTPNLKPYLQGGPKNTGPFLKVYNFCIWWHRKAFDRLKCSALYRE